MRPTQLVGSWVRGRGRVRVRVGERKRVRDRVIIGSGLRRGVG